MAKLSPKQIKYFGTARQKAALKAKRSASAKKAQHKHKARTKPNAARKKKAAATSAPHKKRKNPVPQIIAWTATGNPATKGRHMATKKKKKSASAKKNAGTRHYTKKTKKQVRHKQRNPGDMGRPIDWATGGAGVVLGGLGSRVIPQLVLGASNTGPVGYLANGITAIALGWVSHMFFPKQRFLMYGVILGGMGGLITRIVTEQTPYGASLSTPAAGLGDWGLGLYQKSNFLSPQLVRGPRGAASSQFTWGDGSQAMVAAPSMANMGSDSTGANC